MKFIVGLLWGMSVSLAALAAPWPYDERADAHTMLQQGLADAQSQHKNLLIIFGANWCKDCRDLDKAMHGSSAELTASHFVVVKIDIGNFDKNLDLAQRYGNPIQKGIPAAVVVTATDQMLYSTKAGELADARHMGATGIYDFFSKVLTAPHSPQ